ncbi:ABC transporter ATP-binding protein [Herbiconiux sp. L3-i23]|uniref:ABC transporter ATP-binding protein n=1 Tax=Herbiconiux sp. L3-i23 TaxID=2905871 RepID=UPI002055456D|nr:ABC transporter ATP-binding protein [Herbiconiux sp. L3-i23]BDI21464.1 multidrug ABC transporter ATP-binding protein [Herbiconiux sp. L3-i23]
MLLPIADTAAVRATGARLIRAHKLELAVALALHTLAAIAGLVSPVVIGAVIDSITEGRASDQSILQAAGLLLGTVVAQALLIRFAQRQSLVLGETVFAILRENLLDDVTRLPLATVEKAGTGDLLSRATNDVESIAQTVRFGVPRILVASVTALLTAGTALFINPVVALAMFVGVPILVLASRWYLRRAGAGYQRQLASFARLSGTISETVEGARTIEALGLAPVRRSEVDAALRERRDTERYTLGLRSVFFPLTDFAFLLPIIVVVAWGTYLIGTGGATIGEVTSVALIATQLVGPVNELIAWMDEIQVGTTALSRIVGVGQVPPDRHATGETPEGDELTVSDVRYSYREGIDVLKGIDLDLEPGERLAIVGPSGSGKSTLARLMTGIDTPTSGDVRVGGVRLVDLPVEDLRKQVALVTQEHHLFVGSIAENLRLAKTDATHEELISALRVVDAWPWVSVLPEGVRTMVGSGGMALSPGQSQQLALARLILLDPSILVLDEATSLIDPGAARDLERTMSAVLRGRTVIAIAHRLHTSRDADRVAVMRAGNLTEVGSHEELMALNGDYAELWRTWNS